jgi:hypothetical protein
MRGCSEMALIWAVKEAGRFSGSGSLGEDVAFARVQGLPD